VRGERAGFFSDLGAGFMTDAAAVLVNAIAQSNEVAPPLSWVLAQVPVETEEELKATLDRFLGDVVVTWINPLDSAEVGPRITLTPQGARRFGWRLDDDSRLWVQARGAEPRIKLRPRKRMISLTDLAVGRALELRGAGASGYPGSIADPAAVDPAETIDGSGEAAAELPERRGSVGRRRREAQPQPPAVVMFGCQPWPPRVFDGAGWKCQVCRDRPLSPAMECAWCDRGGQDGLIPLAIRAQIRQSRRTKPARVREPLPLKGGRGT
jgi:hypothetical protein